MPRTLLPIMLLLLGSCVPATAPRNPAPRPHPTRVEFTEGAYTALRFLYDRVVGVEFVACLNAEQRGDRLVVREVIIPWQVGNRWDGVSDSDCTGYSGYVHSHPIMQGQRVCYPSPVDNRTFWRGKQTFAVIWCDHESFAWVIKRPDESGGVRVGGINTYPDRGALPLQPYRPLPNRSGQR